MKINLSFPNRWNSPVADDYFQVDLKDYGLSGLAGFHERTISRSSGLQKDKARWRVINIFMRTCPKDKPKEVRFLTNPGLWWHFERVLTGRLKQQRGQHAAFVCCEKDPNTFKLSAAIMAAVFGGAYVCGSGEVCGGKRRRRFLNCDVFDYLKEHSGQKFSGVWLDLTTVLSEKLGDRLALLRSTLRTDYCMIAVTLIKGREQGSTRHVLSSGKSRKRYLENLVRDSCGDDFRIADVFEYGDSMPMYQIIFLRGAKLSDNAPNFYVGKFGARSRAEGER